MARTGDRYVVLDVATILNVLDDRQKERHVAAPDEDAIDEAARVLLFHPGGFLLVVGQEHQREIRVPAVDLFTEGNDIHAAHARHGDHKIKGLRAQALQRLLRPGCPRDPGRGA